MLGAALKSVLIETPIAPMIAIGDEYFLYLLEFVSCNKLEKEIKQLERLALSAIVPGITRPLQSIQEELAVYFNGTEMEFKTPFKVLGTPFQRSVWEELQKIPKGETRSYGSIARNLGKPTAFRAVAQANGANQLALIIPCHRVINANGKIGGYGGGVLNKEWLLKHEETK